MPAGNFRFVPGTSESRVEAWLEQKFRMNGTGKEEIKLWENILELTASAAKRTLT